jgi:hypothetical protein
MVSGKTIPKRMVGCGVGGTRRMSIMQVKVGDGRFWVSLDTDNLLDHELGSDSIFSPRVQRVRA